MPIPNNVTDDTPEEGLHPSLHNQLADAANDHETRLGALEGAPAPDSPVFCVTRRPEDFGAQRDGVTDDAAAIRAALDSAYAACIAEGTYYCVVQFTAGIYLLSSGTVKGGPGRGNAQIPLPVREPTAGQKVTVVLKGLDDAGAWAHWQQTVSQRSGAVLRSTLTGQTSDATWKAPSVIGGTTVDLPLGGSWSNIRVVVHGLTIVAPLNPSLIAMDLRSCAQADLPNFAALADGSPAQLANSALNSNGIGLYMPAQNNNDSCTIGTYSCEGFYYGLVHADHLVAQRIGLIYCNTALAIFSNPGTRVHGASILYLSIEACVTAIEKFGFTNNKFPIVFSHVNVEVYTTAIKDPDNNLYGTVRWAQNTVGAPTLVGCAHLVVIDMFAT